MTSPPVRAPPSRIFWRAVSPECLSEGRIDFKMLQKLLGDWVVDGNERFGLMWPGKSQCMRVIQEPSTATLKPDRGESVNFETTKNVCL